MDRKHVLSPAAEGIFRRELSLMGADPDDLDRFPEHAQAHPSETTIPEPVSAAGVEAADGSGRFLLQPRPFRLGELLRCSERAVPVGSPG